MFADVDDRYRRRLAESLAGAEERLQDEMQRFPDSLVPLVFKLRETAVAKSHRPIQLAAEAALVPAGHGKLDEMIVAASAESLAALRELILHRDVKAIRCNLSAIERIEPWSITRKIHHSPNELRQRGAAIIRPFAYIEKRATEENLRSVRAAIGDLGFEFEEIPYARNTPLFKIRTERRLTEERLLRLLRHPGIRSIYAEPQYGAGLIAPAAAHLPRAARLMPPPLGVDLPSVGIFDTGVSPNAASLEPWLDGVQTFVLPPETDNVHGTWVASLVAGAHVLNNGNTWLPSAGCKVHDVCGLETAGGGIGALIERLRTAVRARPDIRVWNLSLGGPEAHEEYFSEFSQALDELSDECDVLFVVSSGNYLDKPRRGWPTDAALNDRVAMPAESVRALTVGSVTHLDDAGAWVAAGSPAPYSRRGPGPVFTPKPDIVHVGGGVHHPWSVGPSSVTALGVTDGADLTFGTSFAAPIAAGMAAHAWHALRGRPNMGPHPALVKALLIHSAQLSSRAYSVHERRYYGAGRPSDVLSALYDSDDSFTLVFEAQVLPSMRWRKAPYPIPQCLVHEGKFRGEVIITAVYSPPLNPNAGSEYVRANVEVSFGVLDGERITGKVPMESEVGQTGYESAQVEHGGKWAPVKVHRRVFPSGVSGEQWALQSTVFLRAYEPPLAEALRVTILVTLRALDGNRNVHADGLRALAATNWVREVLPARVPVRV